MRRRRGISPELLQELFDRPGVDLELHLAPWVRAMKTVKHSKAEVLPLLMKSEERDTFLGFSDPIVLNRELLCFQPARMGQFTWHDFSDLAPYTFGLINGYIYDAAFSEAMQ